MSHYTHIKDKKTSMDEAYYKLCRSIRYKRQKVSAEYAKCTGHSVKNCMRVMTGDSVGISLNIRSNRAHFVGLATCGSVWDCPICSAKIAMRRNEEVKQARERWVKNEGYLVLVTYTIRHNKRDSLKDLARVVTDAIRYVHSGRDYQKFKKEYGLAGTISGTEVLLNMLNGWHYHKHQLLFLKRDADSKEYNQIEIQSFLEDKYLEYIRSMGYDAISGIAVNVSDPDTGDGKLPEYICKWGIENEVMTVDEKTTVGLSPFELLDTDEYREEFIEYSIAMKGKRRLTWSNGLRDLLGLDKEKTDDEIASELDEIEGENILLDEIDRDGWYIIYKNNLQSKVLEFAEADQDSFPIWLRFLIKEYEVKNVFEEMDKRIKI